MSIIPEHKWPGRSRARPLTAIQCALMIVTAGLAVAATMLALIDSAETAQAKYVAAVSEAASSGQLSSSSELQAEAEPQRQDSVFAGFEPQATSQRQGSVFAEFQPQAGPYRQGSVFTEFHPQPELTFTPFPPLSPPAGGMSSSSLSPPAGGMSSPSFMPMPVDGTWQVTCGYRCGLHTPANNATFALDIVQAEGETAGQPVRCPVDGQIIAVIDSATYFCGDQWKHGREGGSAFVIELQDPSGAPWRLRLIHLDPDTVPDDLRPDGAPVPVEAGTILGNLAPLDGCAHLHMSLTRLEKTREIPEPMVIAGTLLEDCDGEDCWLGTQLPPLSP